MEGSTSLRTARAAQLESMSGSEFDAVLATIRASASFPRVAYHFSRHGQEFGVTTEAGYLAALGVHLLRSDLRVFTFLRPEGRAPFWALVAPDTGDTALYNEARGRIYSFYRPERPAVRMAAVESHWVELIRRQDGWLTLQEWQWES